MAETFAPALGAWRFVVCPQGCMDSDGGLSRRSLEAASRGRIVYSRDGVPLEMETVARLTMADLPGLVVTAYEAEIAAYLAYASTHGAHLVSVVPATDTGPT